MLTLVPGVSRAGITMTIGRSQGYRSAEAVPFSLLVSVPAMTATRVLIAV
jgi:undecaprenyl pyrophosphate phosphatase UppP